MAKDIYYSRGYKTRESAVKHAKELRRDYRSKGMSIIVPREKIRGAWRIKYIVPAKYKFPFRR